MLRSFLSLSLCVKHEFGKCDSSLNLSVKEPKSVDEVNFIAAYPARKGLDSHTTLSRGELGLAAKGRADLRITCHARGADVKPPRHAPI